MMTPANSSAHLQLRRISLVRVALATALVMTGYASSALAAGSISGQITDSTTHVGIPGAWVQFYDLKVNDDFPLATATADGSGNYSQNLPDGSYGVLTQNRVTIYLTDHDSSAILWS
jgi:hypothetical protein